MGIKRLNISHEERVFRAWAPGRERPRLCELGDQLLIDDDGNVTGVAKDLYESLGFAHTSMDINGRHGAVPVDLERPVPPEFVGAFDIVTDYGTLEHVNGQYQAFRNVHLMCREGGVMIHHLPLAGTYPKHCRYYYTLEFMEGLARACGYDVILPDVLDDSDGQTVKKLVAVAFVKTAGDFISEEEFDGLPGVTDTGDLTHTGDYTRRRTSILDRVLRLLGKTI
jgi:hypothetical protein